MDANLSLSESNSRTEVRVGCQVENIGDTDRDGLIGVPSVVDLLQQQVVLLRQINQRQDVADKLLSQINDRQAAADVSRQAIPSVPGPSSSAWNPLLTSALNSIEPVVDRWRGSIDVLLVFIGLFSAIVASFFVDSVERLSPDETTRTNELLANLTEITIQISGIQASQLNIAVPDVFSPDPLDVRVNVYWSLALVISVSVATLAVSGRAFLSMLTKSSNVKPREKLVDIYRRSEQALSILGPALNTLPIVLTISVVLFLVGLLDTIFSAALQSGDYMGPIIAAASLATATVLLVGAAFIFSVVHAYTHPETSPFRTPLSQLIFSLSDRIRSLRYWRPTSHMNQYNDFNPEACFSEEEKPDWDDDRYLPVEDRVYHATLQGTHDDDALDRAAAALPSICESLHTRKNFLRGKYTSSPNDTRLRTMLSSLEVKSLIHLLSPDASYRCNVTAAECVLRLNSLPTGRSKIQLCSASLRHDLLIALYETARNEFSCLNGANPWSSVLLKAFAALVHPYRRPGEEPNSYIIDMLNSPYISFSNSDDLPAYPEDVGDMTIALTFSTLAQAAHWEYHIVSERSDILSGGFTTQLVDVSILKLLGPREMSLNQVNSLTATRCLCVWSGRDTFFTKYTPFLQAFPLALIPGVVRWIWSASPPQTEDLRIILSSSKSSFHFSQILEELICVIEIRQTWQHFDTRFLILFILPPSENQTRPSTTSSPTLIEAVSHLGGHFRIHRNGPTIQDYSIHLHTACNYAFSALFEMLCQHCQTRSLEMNSDEAVDDALQHILGPRGQNASVRSLDVEVSLSKWDGRSIFTSDAIPEISRKQFIYAIIRWLWNRESTIGDVSGHVNSLTAALDTNHNDFVGIYQCFADVVIALVVHFEQSSNGRLELVFSIMDDLHIDPRKYGHYALSLTSALIEFIRVTTKARSSNLPLSREQACRLVNTYDFLSHLDPGDYSLEPTDNAGADVYRVLQVFRGLWQDLYGSDSLGLKRELLLVENTVDVL